MSWWRGLRVKGWRCGCGGRGKQTLEAMDLVNMSSSSGTADTRSNPSQNDGRPKQKHLMAAHAQTARTDTWKRAVSYIKTPHRASDTNTRFGANTTSDQQCQAPKIQEAPLSANATDGKVQVLGCRIRWPLSSDTTITGPRSADRPTLTISNGRQRLTITPARPDLVTNDDLHSIDELLAAVSLFRDACFSLAQTTKPNADSSDLNETRAP
jgi:hypothetical protein